MVTTFSIIPSFCPSILAKYSLNCCQPLALYPHRIECVIHYGRKFNSEASGFSKSSKPFELFYKGHILITKT